MLESRSSAAREAEAVVVVCPRPRRIQNPNYTLSGSGSSSDLVLGPPSFDTLLINSNKEGKEAKKEEKDEGVEQVMFGGGSPPVRANNPLVHDPQFLIRTDPSHRQQHQHPSDFPPPSSSSNDGSGGNCLVPLVRVQGFDTCTCRSPPNEARVLSAPA